jgi:hypothetical protein
VRNTGGPSAWPKSGQGASYEPRAKSAAAERESEGTMVPVRVATKNATGGKGPCGGHVGVDCGPRPSGPREGASTRCTTTSAGVTSCWRRGGGYEPTRARRASMQ